MTAKQSFELLLLASFWGASFLFMRVATPEFGVFALVCVRVAVAALFLLPIAFIARKSRPIWQHWKPITLVGLTNTAIPFCLFSYATLHLEAGYTSVINATAPMFGALIAVLWLKDKLNRAAVMGLLVGFSGVLILVMEKYSPGASLPILPILAGLGATLLYGVAACYIKAKLQGVESLAVAAGSQLFSTLMLLPLALWFWPQNQLSFSAWNAAILLGVLCTGLAYLMYFRLIASAGATKAITVAYLVPVFGVLWGVLFLQEKLSLHLLLGAAFILFGVALTTGIIKRKRPAIEPAS